ARKVEKPETVERREERTGLAEPHTQLARPGIRTLYLRRRIPAHCHARDPQCHLELRLAGSALRGARQTPEQLQSGGVLRHRDTMRGVAHREPPGLGVILDCASDVAGAREKHSELRRDWFGVSTVGSCLARPDPREPRWRTRRQNLLVYGLPVQRMHEARPQRQRTIGPVLWVSDHQQLTLLGQRLTTALHAVRSQLERSGPLGERNLLTDHAGGSQHLPLIVGDLIQLLADEISQAGRKERREIGGGG